MADGSAPDVQAKPLTPKQQAFAAAYIECGNASEAYRRSYNCKPNISPQVASVEAAKLMAHPSIALAIKAGQARVAERTEITVADIARMLTEDRLLAHKTEDAKAATEASMSLAKLLGHYVEKRNVTSDNRNHNVEERLQPSSEWLAGMLGDASKASHQKPRAN